MEQHRPATPMDGVHLHGDRATAYPHTPMRSVAETGDQARWRTRAQERDIVSSSSNPTGVGQLTMGQPRAPCAQRQTMEQHRPATPMVSVHLHGDRTTAYPHTPRRSVAETGDQARWKTRAQECDIVSSSSNPTGVGQLTMGQPVYFHGVGLFPVTLRTSASRLPNLP